MSKKLTIHSWSAPARDMAWRGEEAFIESSRDPAISTPEVARSMRPRAAFLQSRALRGGNDAKWRPGCAGAATAVTASSAAKAAWFVMTRERTSTEERPKKRWEKATRCVGFNGSNGRREGEADADGFWGVKEGKGGGLMVGGGGLRVYI